MAKALVTIVLMTKILPARDLTVEQEKQVGFICMQKSDLSSERTRAILASNGVPA